MPRTLSRRSALTLAAALAPGLALTACGSGSAAPTAGSSGGGSTRTVRNARGESTVPARASRVVVLDTDALDSVVTLGLAPVGAIGQPSLETIAALRPDLILGNQVRDDRRYDELSKIAPTVFSKTTGPTWKENVRLHAEALGRQAEAEAADAAYRTKLRSLVTALGGPAKAAATRVETARFLAGAPTRLYLNDTFVGSLFKDLGLGRPANHDKPGFSMEISPEQADQAAADVLFYSQYGDAAKSDQGKITEGALWKNLDAVRTGREFRVDDNLWMLGIGYTGAGLVLDEIGRDLASG